MPEPSRYAGRCLCGAVRFEAEVAEPEMGACHCGMCRRWSGGVFLAAEAEAVDVADPGALGCYVSSEWAERCFCKTCGSTMFWRSKDGKHIAVSIQAFENPGDFAFTSQIFIDEKPSTYSFAEPTRTLTGEEAFAAFGAGDGA
ncbi:GFA family protein [Sphingomonas sp. DT-204]|uniref:GFA family protein n=1 Tax=Sphingomonas sp. DT-204 TaxID=3396166 RepID=UPI003F1DD089